MKRFLFPFFSYLLLLTTGCAQVPATNKPLKDQLTLRGATTNLSKYLSAKEWNTLFPNRYYINRSDTVIKASDFYSYTSFLDAAKLFPAFLAEKDTNDQKRELAALLANISLETSGGWPEAPGGYYQWGLYYLEETGKPSSYTDATNTNYPPVAGKHYYGRGPTQLSWNYNYGQFSEAWYGNKDTLLQYPERISGDPVLSFASALWFWMTPQFPKPSCHSIMAGEWKPTADDVAKGRVPGFGSVINVINGGIECGNGTESEKTRYRLQYYEYFCRYLHVSPGSNVQCSSQRPSGQ